MKREKRENKFVIVRGTRERRQFFSFYVDDDSACWSKRVDNAAPYNTWQDAEFAITRLRQRASLKRNRAAQKGEIEG